MPKRRISIFLPALIAVVALPEAVALGMYYYTNDPTLLPLGITKASLSDAPISRNTRAITVFVEWGSNAATPNTRDQVASALHQAMRIYDIEYRVRFKTVPGKNVRIHFLVDSNRIGPYALRNVAVGIPLALAAFRIGDNGDDDD